MAEFYEERQRETCPSGRTEEEEEEEEEEDEVEGMQKRFDDLKRAVFIFINALTDLITRS